ncbi:hypothetical protein DICPUDRAFT_158753 [Dictyostelium purpureum]|uniref:FMN reductase [NAD(P)H] n=1 Tax=Dictyostelium purpureum TaxID=5786 RepID=F1A2E2_DICPU|nr:uncharacterized protein DICPUDRAFT_158753 [Dictyostelium purpureum]EGC29635.1 hypothetical protein DICPUDRAFT_158753 [Dictyostelium purpureum]|eukprot:XP_003293839.1 hypothetical protein DICPUDRAFT_158753 [Dictyostelium purpureum]
MSAQKTIGIIIGSTRENRAGFQIANWLSRQMTRNIKPEDNLKVEIVDLKDHPLTWYNEPHPPKALKPYVYPETIAWSKKIDSIDSFVFLTPTYNGSTSGAMKNAIDYLFKEWTTKPAFVVSYGGAGGSTSNSFLYTLLGGFIKMRLIDQNKTILISLKREFYHPDTNQFKDIDTDLINYAQHVDVAFEELKNLLNTPIETAASQ